MLQNCMSVLNFTITLFFSDESFDSQAAIFLCHYHLCEARTPNMAITSFCKV